MAFQAPAPKWLSNCTCSYCHKSGVLWGEVNPEEVRLDLKVEPTAYVRGDATLAFNFCPVCGNLGWWRSLEARPARMKLNFRWVDPKLISTLPVRTFDGAESWRYLDELE